MICVPKATGIVGVQLGIDRANAFCSPDDDTQVKVNLVVFSFGWPSQVHPAMLNNNSPILTSRLRAAS